MKNRSIADLIWRENETFPQLRQAFTGEAALNLRIATDEDISQLSRLLEILFAQEEEFTPNVALQEAGLRTIISNPQVGEIMLAEADGKIIGMVSLLYTVSTALGARAAILEDMVVDPIKRGDGVGSKLLEYALQISRERGCARITLLTDAGNLGAQRFYERFGFTKSTMIPLRRSQQCDWLKSEQ
ncbi:GNAT superfamily N-acetyltransferase [Methylocaldum sp. RMAD-M]|jgi:GNAT superfamily N-acetyltransferase|nr:GNAT superfamily N-acetyltransferase [Methylocaldum sp. RMAD-M]